MASQASNLSFIDNTAGQITITTNTASISTSTGALIVAGGAGIGQNLYVGGSIYGNTIYSNGLPVLTSGTTFSGGTVSGAINITNTTSSTSTVTGALIVAGGAGIGKDLYVKGTIYQNGVAVATAAGSASGSITMYQSGYLTVTQGTQRWYAPYNLNVTAIKTKLGTAGSNANVITINKNAAPVTNITINGGATSGTTYTTPLSMNEDDYLTVDVTPVTPQTTTATNLYVQFKYQAV
jgi:hypothetical protein